MTTDQLMHYRFGHFGNGYIRRAGLKVGSQFKHFCPGCATEETTQAPTKKSIVSLALPHTYHSIDTKYYAWIHLVQSNNRDLEINSLYYSSVNIQGFLVGLQFQQKPDSCRSHQRNSSIGKTHR